MPASSKTKTTIVDQLNRAMPANRDAQLGSLIADLITSHNALLADLTALRTAYNTMLAKLDADAGVTDTNYAATGAAPTLTAATVADIGTR